jgi:hypothetical protein
VADFYFRKLLRDYQITNDLQASKELFAAGQRLGFSLVDYRDLGVPWTLVRENLWQLNPVFLSQEEVADYKDWLHESTNWHPKFIDRIYLFARARGDWHPTYPLIGTRQEEYAHRRPLEGYVSVMVGSLSPHLENWGSLMRLAFWGADDTGREVDIGDIGKYTGIPTETDEETLQILEDIIRKLPSQITTSNLSFLGFYNA